MHMQRVLQIDTRKPGIVRLQYVLVVARIQRATAYFNTPRMVG